MWRALHQSNNTANSYNRICFLINPAFFFFSNQDVEVEKQCHFAIVNMKTATTAAVRIVFQLQVLDIL